MMKQEKRQRGLELEQAMELLLAHGRAVETEGKTHVLSAVGRVVCGNVSAQFDQPPFDRSPLDGYAVHHEDIAGASKDTPVVLRVAGTVYAGDVYGAELQCGEAVRVTTGAMLPEGATTVVRQEHTDEGQDTVKSMFRIGNTRTTFCAERIFGRESALLNGENDFLPRISVCWLGRASLRWTFFENHGWVSFLQVMS